MTFLSNTFWTDNVREWEGPEEPDTAVAGMPKLDAYEGEAGGWRLQRLASTFGMASATVALMSHKYQAAWNGAIVALYDEKGSLHVTWRDKESRWVFEGAIVGAWQKHGEPLHSHLLAAE